MDQILTQMREPRPHRNCPPDVTQVRRHRAKIAFRAVDA